MSVLFNDSGAIKCKCGEPADYGCSDCEAALCDDCVTYCHDPGDYDCGEYYCDSCNQKGDDDARIQ